MKFNTRQYYGIIDHSPGDESYMRVPVWYALRMLSELAGVRPGARLCATTVTGPLDEAAAHVVGVDSPWIECTATGGTDGFSLVVINRGMAEETADIAISGLSARSCTVTRCHVGLRSHRTEPRGLVCNRGRSS